MTTQYEVGLILKADGKGFKGEVRLSREELEKLGLGAKKATPEVKGTGEALKRTGREARAASTDIRRAEQATGGLTGASRNLSGAMRTLGVGLTVGGLARLTASSVQAGAEFEKLENRITFFTGSTSETAKEMAFAAETADRLAVAERSVIQSRAQLLPLEKANIIAREQSLGVTVGLINASKALGAEQAQIGQVMFGLGQALSSSTVRAEEFNQVVEPLPGLAQAMNRAIAEMTGNAKRNFRQMINEGEVSNDLFARVLVRALKEFEGAGERSVGTVIGSTQLLTNEWERLKRSISNSEAVTVVLTGWALLFREIRQSMEAAPELPLIDQIEAAEKRVATIRGVIPGAQNDGDRADAKRQLQEAIDELSELRIRLATEEAAIAVAAKKAEDDALAKARDTALSRLDAAPQSIGQKADKIRGFISAIRADIDAGLTEATAAAPAIAAYQAQLDKLLKKTVAPDPVGDFASDRGTKLIAAQWAQTRALLDRRVAEGGSTALTDYASREGSRRGIDLGGLVSFENVEASAAAVRAYVAELEDLEDTLRGSKIAFDSDGLPADPAVRAAALQNAAAIARLAGETEAHRLAVSAIGDAEEARAKAAEDAADAHKASVEMIAEGLDSLKSPYDKAIVDARKWREEALAGLDPSSAGFADFSAEAERVYQGQVADARDAQAKREASAVGTVASALTALKTPYEQAIASAEDWRMRTREALAEAGVDAEAHAATIEEVFQGRIARAEAERADRQRQVTDGIASALRSLDPSYARSVEEAGEWADATRAALEEAGLAAGVYAGAIDEIVGLRLRSAYDDDLDRRKDWAAGIERGLRDMRLETEDFASTSEDALRDLSDAGEDAFVKLATGGKIAVGDLVDSVLADFARLAYQQTIGKSVNGLFGQILGSVGSILGGGSGTQPITLNSAGNPVGIYHTGGVAGVSGGALGYRSFSGADIARAPRYHSGGVAGDEVLSVLKRGEPVFTPRQFDNMNGMIAALAGNAQRPIVVEGGGGSVDIRVAPELAVRRRDKPDGTTSIDIFQQMEERLAGNVAAGRGPLAKGIQRRFAVRQNFTGTG